MTRLNYLRDVVFESFVQSVVFLTVLTVSLVMFRKQLTSSVANAIEEEIGRRGIQTRTGDGNVIYPKDDPDYHHFST